MTRNKLREEFNQELRVFGNFDEKWVMPFITTGCCILTKTISNRLVRLIQLCLHCIYILKSHNMNLQVVCERYFLELFLGNIKEEGVLSIEKNGPFQITGDHKLMHEMDVLLSSFCRQQRMKLSRDTEYKPCYKISLREKR